jgi:hypothetical protein
MNSRGAAMAAFKAARRKGRNGDGYFSNSIEAVSQQPMTSRKIEVHEAADEDCTNKQDKCGYVEDALFVVLFLFIF